MENLHSRRITVLMISLSLVLMISVLLPRSGYSQFRPGQKHTVENGEEGKIKGVILTRSGDTFILRDIRRNDTDVVLTNSTKVRTERKGLFGGLKPFDVTVLEPGLIVEVRGKGDAQGRLVAEDIRFSEADLKAAIAAYTQTAPVRKQAAETEKQLAETEKKRAESEKKLAETEKKLSESEKKLAETRQEVVDTNKRISELDQYDLVKTVTLLFPVDSAKLGDEQKAQLDELASKAPGAKNYLVEVQGFADPTGRFHKNLKLSQARAEAVVQYLTVKHNIPLRRIMIPMGYGASKPASTEKTPEAHEQERRVEVRVLVNKGLNQ
jgi:outer membrane protein OmpA-like peptidoglycan-associated protein